MEDIIKMIDIRIKVIESRKEQHLYNCGVSQESYNLKYIKQLRSERNFLESLMEHIMENKEIK